MTGAELRRALERIFGDHWRIPSAEWLGVDLRTLDRQCSGAVDVRGPIIAAVHERQKLEDIRAAWSRRQDRWRKKGAKLPKYQRAILTSAAAGEILIASRPPGAKYIGIWEAQIINCQDHGWLDEDRQITELGRNALTYADQLGVAKIMTAAGKRR